MALWIVFSAIAIIGSVVDAIPTIAFALNSQVPPVVRVSEPFSYTFSNSTFSSDLPLSYTLSSGPNWLSLDGSTRTLSGTPSAGDVGTNSVTGMNIELTASDRSGSVTLNATLVVSTNPAPVINLPLSAQLATFGSSSLPSTILYHPSTNFKFNFEPGTFSENGGSSGLNYYCITAQNTPLPSWIQFDGSSLSFVGRTPDYESLIQPPQTFAIQLVASDVEGFSGVAIPFEIEVGVHLLAFETADMVINTTARADVNFNGLSNNLQIDGMAANASILTSVTAQTPPWLVFDNSTFALSGTVPADAVSSNVTVQATDIYGDTDSATVLINITNTIFKSSIGNLNVTSGSSFSFDFSSYVQDKYDVEITAKFSPIASWIAFDSKTFIMSGQVPPATSDFKIVVTLGATSRSSGTSASLSFDLYVVSGPLSSPPPGSASDTHSATAKPTSKTTDVSSSGTSSPLSVSPHKGLSTGVAVTIGVLLSLLLISILFALCVRTRRRWAAKRLPKNPSKIEIAAPIEPESSVEEIIRPVRVVPPPEPLYLDTSGFTTEHSTSTSTFANEGKRRSSKLADNPLRRSQTTSALSGPQKAEFRQSNSTTARAYSDIALGRTEKSRRVTQDSAYPTISSSSQTNSSHRLTRNYSRKGQNRRSGRIKSRDSAFRDSKISSQRPQSTILNLGDSNFSCTPLDNFSVLSKRTSGQETSEFAYSGDRLQQTKQAKRESRFVPGIDQRSGVGHGGRESITSSTGLPSLKRRSVGHGQNWEPIGLPRDSRTWLTVDSATTGRQQDRLSHVSAITEDTNVLEDQVAPLSSRAFHNTGILPHLACLSDSIVSTRPVSRRVVGSSPFFAGGGSLRSSKKSPNKVRTSYADSPTVPEEPVMESLDNTFMAALRKDNKIPQDSFGISYGVAREGTRNLRSYIQSRRARAKTSGSMKSNGSKDSRFESAESLHQSQPNIIVHNSSSKVGLGVELGGSDEYEDYLPDDYSEGSWETHRTAPRDSLGNIVGYEIGEPLGVGTSVAQRNLAPSTALGSNPLMPMRPDIEPNARIVEGRGKRPLSVDVGANQGSVRAALESDYKVYL